MPVWEESGTIEDVVRIAEAADALGYDHITCSEHFAVPRSQAVRRGGTYWDPLSTFGYVAARTTRIRLATNVLVLGYHHPLEIAKRYGTLDRVSGGRLSFSESASEPSRRSSTSSEPHTTIEGTVPTTPSGRCGRPSQTPSPATRGRTTTTVTWSSTRVPSRSTCRSGSGAERCVRLRRAAELADGWCPFGVSSDQAGEWLRRTDLPPGFEVRLSPENLLDPTAEPTRATDALGSLAEAGATIVEARLVHHSLEHYLEQIRGPGASCPALAEASIRHGARVSSMVLTGSAASNRRLPRRRWEKSLLR